LRFFFFDRVRPAGRLPARGGATLGWSVSRG
jgi:hypothetical protein